MSCFGSSRTTDAFPGAGAVCIILLFVFSIAVSLSFELGNFINADKLPGALLVGLGPVVCQVPLPEERDGVYVQDTFIDEVVIIGTDG